MKGLLEKKSNRINAKWNQYYFVVAPRIKRLYYYRSKEAVDNESACKGSIRLTALFPQPVGDRRPGKRQHRFDVQGTPYNADGMPDRNKTVVYSLSAPTKEDKTRWVQAINEACSNVLGGRGGQESSFAQFGNIANLGGILSDNDDDDDTHKAVHVEATARQDTVTPRDLLIDSLHYGDIVYLQWQVGEQPGYLHADGVCRTRLGIQPFGADPQAPDAQAPQNFQECLFRICPPLLYEASIELQNMRLECGTDEGVDETLKHAARQPHPLSEGKKCLKPLQAQQAVNTLAAVSVEADDNLHTSSASDDLVVAHAEAERESSMNLRVLTKLERSGGDRVLYGAPVQLQHVRSGKFVTVRRIQARKTPSAMRLELIDNGDHHSAFKLSPHFRNRVEGGYVYIGDEVKFESLRFPREFIHATQSPFDKVEARVGATTREKIEQNKKTLITEVNLVSKMTGWSLLLYSRPSAPEYQGLLTNSPVRLFHADAQAFITASANHEKCSMPPFETAPVECLGDRHLPYMRPLPDGDPYDLAAQSAKEVWCFELPDKCKAAALRWSHKHVRIKHLPTRKYLAVEDLGVLGQDVQKHSCKLTHEMNDNTLFTLVKDELIEGDVLPAQEISLLIMHELQPGRPVWLHRGKEHKEKVLYNSDGTQRGTTQSNSFKMWFSAERKPQDTVKVLPCDAIEARGIETVRSMVKVTECFTQRLKESSTDPSETALHQYAFDEVQLMLVTAINFVTEVDQNVGSCGATLLEQATDALKVEGLPRTRQQQQACDLKLLDKLMRMQQVVVDACPPEQWEFAESYTLDLVAQRPRQLLVHKLCFHAIARILESNVKVQNYFGRQRIQVPKRSSNSSSDGLQMGAIVGAMADGAADAGRKLLGAVGDAGNMIGNVSSVSLSDISDGVSNSVGKLGDGAIKLGDGALKLGSGLVQASSKMIGQAGQAGARVMSGDINFLAPPLGEQAQVSERPKQPDTFIGAIIRQINASHDMGAANCLRKLVTDNMNLLETYVDAETIENFVELIKKRGPRPEFLQFLATVCSCNGSAVASNQAACLQALLKNSQGRGETKLLLETRNFEQKSAELDDFSTTMRELGWKDAAGRDQIKNLKKRSDEAQKGDPHSQEAREAIDKGDFLGYEERVSGFPVIYVSWNGASERDGVDLPRTLSFEAGTRFWEDHFFVSGEELDHPSTDEWREHFFPHEGTFWVPLSYLVWVLDPEAQLYESFVKDGCLPFQGCKEDFNRILRAGNDKFKSGGKYSDAMDYKPRENDADDEQHFSQCVWEAYARGYLRIHPKTLQDLDDDDAIDGDCAAPELQLSNGGNRQSRRQDEGEVVNEHEDKVLDCRRHRESFRLQLQLAEYYVAQIELFAQMCLGRQYQTILKLEKMFSYSMLLSAMANDTLPFQVRAAFTRLLLRLYVDRYPQQKLQIPQMIHVLKDYEGRVDVKHYNMDKDVDDHNSELPEFRLGAANTDLLNDKRQHYNFPGPSKFRLVREFIVEFLKCDENKTMALHRENKNEFMLAVLEMLDSLVKFGFFNSISKIHDLADPLITQLDGRMDRANNDVIFAKEGFPWQDPSTDQETKEKQETKEREFKEWSAHRRYSRGTKSNPLAMKVKTQACKVLAEIGSLRDDFRLRLMVNLFKGSLATIAEHRQQHNTEWTDTPVFSKEAQDALIFEEIVPEPGSYHNEPVQRLAAKYRGKNGEIHKLFASKAAQAFDLERKTSKSLVTLLLDLMMYEDSDLFTQALVLFWRRNNQKAKLLEKLRDVVILDSEYLGRSESEIETLSQLHTRVAHMRKEVNEWQLWSQHNEEVGTVGFIGTENVAEHVKSGLRQLEMFCFKHEEDTQACDVDNRKDAVANNGSTAEEDETKDDNLQPEPSISDLWHGLLPVPMHQRLLADLGAHDIFLKAISVPWQSIYDQEIKLANAMQKQERQSSSNHEAGGGNTQVPSTISSVQLAKNAAHTRKILLQLVAQGLSGLTGMLRGQPASAATAPADANARARWETERAQIKHTQRVLHEFLPQVQHVLKRMVKTYKDERDRQVKAEAKPISVDAGDAAFSTLSTSPWEYAHELLEHDGIIMSCTVFITELFRRNDEIQTTAELFQQFAELVNAAAEVSPILASKYLPFYECVLVSETGEPLTSNQARALPPLVDAVKYPNIIPNFIDVNSMNITLDWRKFVQAIEYQAGLMTTFANCARGENNVGLTDLLQLLPEKGLGLNGLLAYIDALLTGLVPGIVPSEESMHEHVFTFDSPFSSWRTLSEQISPIRHSFLRTNDAAGSRVCADALTTTMRKVPGSDASARAVRQLLRIARKGSDEERVEKFVALWHLLSAATDMLQQVFCDTSLVDFTFALHDTMWGDRQTPFNSQGAAVIPKLAHAVAVLGLDWWPGARGHQLCHKQETRFMAELEREACCGYMLRHGMPLLETFFRSIWPHGGSTATAFIWKEKTKLLRAVTTLAECVDLSDLECTTGAAREAGVVTSTERKQLQATFPPAKDKKNFRLVDSAHNVRKCAVKLIEALVSDSRTGRGVVSEDWISQTKKDIRSMRSTGGRSTHGLGRSRSRDDMEREILDHRAHNVQAAWRNPAAYFATFVKIASTPGNWLSDEARDEFDDFVHLITCVEEWTSGEQHAGKPTPSAEANSFSHGLKAGMENLITFGTAKKDELDKIILEAEEPLQWFKEEADKERLKGMQHVHVVGEAVGSMLHTERGPPSDTFKSLMRRVTLEQLVRRMVDHITHGILNPSMQASYEAECVLFDMLRRVIGRWKNDLTTGEPNHTTKQFTPEEHDVIYERNQNDLNDWGATELVVLALGAEGLGRINYGAKLFDHALQLGCELLENGNAHVQATMLTQIAGGDARAETFFRHLKERVREYADKLDRLRQQAAQAGADDEEEEDGMFELGINATHKALMDIFRFLQLCCEGHNHDMQTIVRVQPASTKKFDLLQEAITILCSYAKTKRALTRMQKPEMELLVKLMAFLTEAMQGPHSENQAAVAQSGVPDVVMRVMGASFRLEQNDNENDNEHAGHALVAELRSQTMRLVAAMLEGRQDDRTVHNTLVQKLGASTIKHCLVTAHRRIEFIDELLQEGYFSTVGKALDIVLRRDLQAHKRREDLIIERHARLNEAFDLFATASTLSADNPDLERALRPDVAGARAVGELDRERTYAATYKMMKARFSSCEVQWGGAVHQVFFIMPEEELAPLRMSQVRMTMDLGAGRLTEFVDTATRLSREMDNLAEQDKSLFTMFFKRNYFVFKYALYAVVVLLNLVVLATIEAPDNASEGQNVTRNQFVFENAMRYSTSGANYLAYLLSFVAVAGYGCIVAYAILSYGPLVYDKMARRRHEAYMQDLRSAQDHAKAAEDEARRAEERDAHKEELMRRARSGRLAVCGGWIRDQTEHWGDWSAFKAFSVSLCAYLVFGLGLAMQQQPDLQFGEFPSRGLQKLEGYGWFGLVVMASWFLFALRQFWSARNKGLRATFCVAIDILAHHEVYWHAIMVALAVGTSMRFFFAPVILLDIVTFNETLSNVVNAAVRPYKQLLMTFVLFLIVILVYTSFGMFFFGDHFVSDDDAGEHTCPDLLRCFLAVASNGIRQPEEAGGVMGILFSHPDFIARVVYDVTFYIVVGALMFNMVTGIIVDTFGELREQSKERAEILRDMCFICGITRAQLEELGPGGETFDFDTHMSEEHDMWRYVYFINYLTNKPDTEYNGVEAYVMSMIAAKDVSWFPVKRWIGLQELERRTGVEAVAQADEHQQELQLLREQVKQLMARNKSMETAMQENFTAVLGHLKRLQEPVAITSQSQHR